MASQRDQKNLKKVGLEGFALIEECYGRTKRPIQSQILQSSQPQLHQSHYENYSYYQQHQHSYFCQVPQVYTVKTEAVTNYPGASQLQYSDGWSIAERPQVSVAKESVVSSNEAARFYGGTMITDYRKNMPLRRAYY